MPKNPELTSWAKKIREEALEEASKQGLNEDSDEWSDIWVDALSEAAHSATLIEAAELVSPQNVHEAFEIHGPNEFNDLAGLLQEALFVALHDHS